MKIRLTTKLYASILAVTVLALLSSVLGLFATWQMAILMREMTEDNLPTIREAEKVESSLLKQNADDESYILDNGNRRWLNASGIQKKTFPAMACNGSDHHPQSRGNRHSQTIGKRLPRIRRKARASVCHFSTRARR